MDTDFLIIGGGIAGVSAAAELSDLGTVTLCESEDNLAHHASGRSAALYEPYYGPPAVVALSLASGDDLAPFCTPRGVLMVASADDADGFAAEADQMHLAEIPVDQACALFPALDPAKVARAGHADHARDIDTDALIQSYARRARQAGAQIHLRSPVTAIERTGTGWDVTTPQANIRARVIVNAAGPWADPIARMAGVAPRGITPLRRSMARIPAPGGMDPSAWPTIFGIGETWYAKPDAGALIVSPADADPADPHDAWADDMTLAEGLARYEEMMRFPVDRLLASWAGLRSFAPDGTPVYGRDPDDPAFIWFAGQGGYGFQSSIAAARFLADIVAERATDADLAAALSPARFTR